jgi:transmembrane sensor
MDNKELLELIKKHNKGTATDKEKALLESYYQLFELKDDGLSNSSFDEKQNLQESIRTYLHQNISTEKDIPVIKVNYRKWAAAAVLLIAFTATFLFINNDSKDYFTAKSNVDTLIVPGSNQAVLTLADGSEITLNNNEKGTLSNKNGVIITKNEDGLLTYKVTDEALASINSITTPRGGQYQLILSDGTKVWINADTKITFPTKFDGKERNVSVIGEAYFEVAKNKHKPFKVHTQNQIVEVLGTHFNINSYGEDDVAKTTLLEGSVKVSLLKAGVDKILVPGEAAHILKNTKEIQVLEVDTAWKNGYFRFDNIDMRSLMSQVSRWYNVDVEYKGDVPTDLFSGKLKRSDNIHEIIRILELNNINIGIEGRKIIISNKL